MTVNGYVPLYAKKTYDPESIYYADFELTSRNAALKPHREAVNDYMLLYAGETYNPTMFHYAHFELALMNAALKSHHEAVKVLLHEFSNEGLPGNGSVRDRDDLIKHLSKELSHKLDPAMNELFLQARITLCNHWRDFMDRRL